MVASAVGPQEVKDEVMTTSTRFNDATTCDNNKKNNGSNYDPNFERKFDLITEGSRPYLKNHLLTKITHENCKTIVDYVLALMTEVGPSENYRLDVVGKLKHLAHFHHPKAFKDMTRQDAIDFLDRLRKPEALDPLHQWIGSYESNRIVLLRFFKWLYHPDIGQKKRPKPPVMENIPTINRKEISIYKPTDLWTEEDDALFLKYCPSPRDRCWHMVSRDTGCRPHEMLALKIKDIAIIQTETYQIAKVTVNGKTGTITKRLHKSYPSLKEWLSQGNHPYPTVPNSHIFCGIGDRNTGRKLSNRTMNAAYEHYKNILFPRLLDDPTVPPEDKQKIKELLKKRWNLYVRRHTAATEISKRLKDPVLVDQYMGWSHKGKTRQKYEHYYDNDSIEALLEADGLKPAAGSNQRKRDLLKPVQCPNCEETNKYDARFCSKCKYVLSYDAYQETIHETEQYKKRFEELEARQKMLEIDSKTRQQQEIEQMKATLDRTQDQVGMLLQMLTSVNQEEPKTTGSKKDFLLRKLGVLTNGKLGEDPNNPGIVVEPVEPNSVGSKPCVICKMIEEEEQQEKKMIHHHN